MSIRNTILEFLVFCFVFISPALVMAEEANEDVSTGTYDDAVEESQRLFLSGDYLTTIDFLNRAYAEHNDPTFLQNIGTCHARLENFCRASEYYQRFLDEGDPDQTLRITIEGRIEDYNRRCEPAQEDPVQDPERDPTVFGQDSPPPYDPGRLYTSSYILWGIGAALTVTGTICWGVAYSDRFEVDGASNVSISGDVLLPTGLVAMAIGLVTYLVGYFRARRSRAESQETALELNYAYADY